jgi:hypothetical protein
MTCSLYNTQLLTHLSNTPFVGTVLQMREAASGDDMDITGNQGHTCHSRWYCLVPLADEDKPFPLHSSSKEEEIMVTRDTLKGLAFVLLS